MTDDDFIELAAPAQVPSDAAAAAPAGITVTLPEALTFALRHYQAGQLDDADTICDGILAQQPGDANALHLKGLVAFKRGEPARAVTLIELSLARRPGDAEMRAHLGAALQNSGQSDRAMEELRRSLELKPEQPEVLRNLGMVLRGRGRFEEAAEHYRTAIAIDPDYPDAHTALAVAMLDLGRPQDAIAGFQRALALRREDPEPYSNLGVVLMNQGRLEEAIVYFEHALALKSDYADAQANYGSALLQEGRIEEAVARFRSALASQPDHVDALVRLAGALGLELETQEADAAYARAIEAKPELAGARIARCISQVPILYRDEAEILPRREAYRECLEELCREYDAGRVPGNLAEAVASNQPFYLAYQGCNDRELQMRYGELMCRAVADAFPAAPMPPPPGPDDKVRVGIVAGLFRHHTVWKLMIRGWLTQLDRRRFEVFAYHTAEPQDELTGLARQLCNRFVQGPLTLAKWREEILADAPHVLVYPDIGMDPGAGHLAAHRLAPVQCMSFGHPNTSGYPTLDYFLSSEMMEPPDADEHYSETLIRLPNLAFYYEPLAVKSVGIDRAGLGLKPDDIAFWSGQSLFKYLPQYDEVYARIAAEVPRAKFLFIEFMAGRAITDMFRARLNRAFAAHGRNWAEHCILLPRLPTEVFVAAIGACDVVLDTPAWSGGNTTLEGLNHGVPIVTWPSGLMRGRVTMAVLQRMGVTETIAETIDDYISIATRLAQDEGWRRSLRDRIAANKHRIYCDPECIAALSDFLEQAARGEPVNEFPGIAAAPKRRRGRVPAPSPIEA